SSRFTASAGSPRRSGSSPGTCLTSAEANGVKPEGGSVACAMVIEEWKAVVRRVRPTSELQTFCRLQESLGIGVRREFDPPGGHDHQPPEQDHDDQQFGDPCLVHGSQYPGSLVNCGEDDGSAQGQDGEAHADQLEAPQVPAESIVAVLFEN